MKQIIYYILSLWLIVGIPFSTQTVLAQSSSLPGQPKSKFSPHQSLTQEKSLKNTPSDKVQATPGVRHGHVLDLSSVVPDPSFGTNGSVRTFISSGDGTDDEAHSVAIQSNGKIVVTGVSAVGSGNAFGLARYNTDGSLDSTFGINGSTINYINGGSHNNDEAFSVAIQTDGKIVAAGYSFCGSYPAVFSFALARYEVNGSLDSTFGTNGTTTNYFSGGGLHLTAYIDCVNSVAIQSDGKIVAAGYSTGGSQGSAFSLARYNTNGSLDNTFGTNGTTTNYVYMWLRGGNSPEDWASSIAIQSDGEIVAAGGSKDANNHYAFALARYNSDGSVDNTFVGQEFCLNGTTRNNINGGDGTYDAANSVAMQSNGKIVAAGYSHGGSGYAFALARYNTDGSLDNTFGTNGTTRNAISGGDGTDDEAFSVGIQSDGKIVAVGFSHGSPGYAFALARYNTDGSLDNTFGINGSTINCINGGNGEDDRANSVAVQSDGKIVAAGFSKDASSKIAFAVARYLVPPAGIWYCKQSISHCNNQRSSLDYRKQRFMGESFYSDC